MDRFSFGQWCEEQVAQHLECVRGWRMLARRVRYKGGELDLVAETPDGELFFVEVKGRRGDAFGSPLESMTGFKQLCLRRSALEWKRRQGDFREARFLFVGVEVRAGQPVMDFCEF